jgi:hypothetical protein
MSWSIEGYIDTAANKILQMLDRGELKQSQTTTAGQIDTAK